MINKREIRLNIKESQKNKKLNKRNKTIKETITELPNYLFFSGRTESTVVSYVNDIIVFYNFIKDEKRITQINQIRKPHLMLYVEHCVDSIKSDKIKPSTANRRIASLKVYLKYLECTYNSDPSIRETLSMIDKQYFFKRSKTFKTYQPALAVDDIVKIIKTIKDSKSNNSIRDEAIFRTLFATSCRKTELLNLKWIDINVAKNTIHITRMKNRTENVLMVERDVIDSLIRLRTISEKQSMNDFVFQSPRNPKNALSSNALHNIVSNCGKHAEIDFDISPHTIRRTFVTLSVENGVAYDYIQAYTGHRRVSSISEYASILPSIGSQIIKGIGLSGRI